MMMTSEGAIRYQRFRVSLRSAAAAASRALCRGWVPLRATDSVTSYALGMAQSLSTWAELSSMTMPAGSPCENRCGLVRLFC